MSFEGSEKRLEIDFSHSSSFSSIGLRQIARSDLDKWMYLTHCSIISSSHLSEFDAYVLSESSLFITPQMVVLKTCGTTRILDGLSMFLSLVDDLGMQPKRVKYSHASFLFPDAQYDPHRKFESEVAVLHEYFGHLKEASYVLGNHSHGLQWHLYHALDACPTHTNRRSVEMVMTGLHPLKALNFFRTTEFVDSRTTTYTSGIAELMPGAVWDDHMFEPCGYSVNGLSVHGYLTVHVTPEEDCSYASVEFSCLKSETFNLEKKLKQVTNIFDPQEIYISMHSFTPMDLVHFKELEGCLVGWSSDGMTLQYLRDGSHVAFKANIRETSSIGIVSKLPSFSSQSDTCGSDCYIPNDGQSTIESKTFPLWTDKPLEHIGSMDIPSYMRHLIATKELTQTFAVMNLTTVQRLYQTWCRYLPRVEPYYAVKCYPDATMIRLLGDMGASFDCASEEEIRLVLNLGVPPSRIIFANACKHPSDVAIAHQLDINLTTFDMPLELEKIRQYAPHIRALIRIRADDPDARCLLGNKYGAEMQHLPGLYEKAKTLGVKVVGVSFHVGSGATNPEAFISAIELAKVAFDLGSHYGFDMSILDIGGGFCSGDVTSDMSTFFAIQTAVNVALDHHFPVTSGIKIIAEPGRYFAETCVTLGCAIIGIRDRQRQETIYKDYWITDGLYGSFNCIPYDHTIPKAIPLWDSQEIVYPSTVFGPTCDGLDTVLDDVPLPAMHIGDWLIFPDMGAYTFAGASNFNGMHRDIKVFYVWTD